MAPAITGIDCVGFTYEIKDVTTNPNGYNLCYEPGSSVDRTTYALRVHTDLDVTGAFVGGTAPGFAQLRLLAANLIGENPLERERL